MKKLIMLIVCMGYVITFETHTQSLAKLESVKCCQCGTVLTSQEIMLCQIACAQQEEILYICLGCAKDKKNTIKGKLKKEKEEQLFDNQIDGASSSWEHSRVTNFKKEERRKKHKEHLAQNRFPMFDETIQIKLLGGDTVTVEPDKSALSTETQEGVSKKYIPIADYGKIKTIVEATGTKILVIFENEEGYKTVRVFDTKTNDLALPSQESMQDVFNQLERQNKLLDGLYNTIVKKMRDCVPASVVALFSTKRATCQELMTVLKDVSCDANGMVEIHFKSPDRLTEGGTQKNEKEA